MYVQQCGMKLQMKWFNYLNQSFGRLIELYSYLIFCFNIRLDSDQHARRTVQKNLRIVDPDYYRFETHVLFDDAFEDDEDGNRVPNRYVKQLVAAVNVSGAYVDIFLFLLKFKISFRYVHGVEKVVEDPIKIPTPYGGRLVWLLPGKNRLIVHMKDKNLIRHKKRWSQVSLIIKIFSLF
jgi:chitin synthase